MYHKALIDIDSLVRPSYLDNLEVVSTYEEKWPGEDPEILHIAKVRIVDDQVERRVEELSRGELLEGWFAVIWNERRALVILKDKIFTLKNIKPWDEQEFAELVGCGSQEEIDPKYFHNMRAVMDAW